MARRQRHHEHLNHEAWAIPYGDLVTLLLAFFVVMYAISSVNEGKYRVLSDSLAEAFGGPPRTISPLQLGQNQPLGSAPDRTAPLNTPGAKGAVAPVPIRAWPTLPRIPRAAPAERAPDKPGEPIELALARERLGEISARVEEALSDLIDRKLIRLRRQPLWLEIEIRSDILFASGAALPEPSARPILVGLAQALQPFPNPLRIEGHTDDVPIRTALFPSNWELSAARAASVVHLFAVESIAERRMAVVGHGETRPIGDNRDPEGRRDNRRVVVVVLAHPEDGTVDPDSVRTAMTGHGQENR